MADYSGPASVAMHGNLIPSTMLSEVNIEVQQGTRTRDTLGGSFTRNSGRLETAQATFTLFLPNIDFLQYIIPDQYVPGTGTQETGQINWEAGVCSLENIPVNIHPECNDTDDDDTYFPAGSVVLNFNPTFNTSDEVTVEVMVYGNPDSEGLVVRGGTGDTTEPSIYDPEDEDTKPVTS